MKKRFLSLLFALLLLFSLSTAAYGVDARASDYFSYTSVRAYAKSGGKILFEVDINATHTMQEVGASATYIAVTGIAASFSGISGAKPVALA